MTSTSPVKPLTMLDTNVLVDALYEDLPEKVLLWVVACYDNTER
jgi:hypothetical protein